MSGNKIQIGDNKIIILSYRIIDEFVIANYVFEDNSEIKTLAFPSNYDFIVDGFKSEIKFSYCCKFKEFNHIIPLLIYETDKERYNIQTLTKVGKLVKSGIHLVYLID